MGNDGQGFSNTSLNTLRPEIDWKETIALMRRIKSKLDKQRKESIEALSKITCSNCGHKVAVSEDGNGITVCMCVYNRLKDATEMPDFNQSDPALRPFPLVNIYGIQIRLKGIDDERPLADCCDTNYWQRYSEPYCFVRLPRRGR